MNSSTTNVPRNLIHRQKSVGKKLSDIGPKTTRIVEDTHPRTADRPIHVPQDSLFSSTSGYTNYRGFFNLAIILLVVSNSRVALENVMKYGILANPFQIVSLYLAEPYHWPILSLFAFINLFSLIAFVCEKALAEGALRNKHGAIIHTLNLTTMLVMPSIVIIILQPNPIRSCICLTMYSIVFLKLVSYSHVNYWCRIARRRQSKNISMYENDKKKGIVTYPNNLNVGDLCYFLCAPTLCYELNFPRTSKIRKWFVLKRLMESLFLPQVIVALHQQWTMPLIKNSVGALINMESSRMVERLLKLAIPNHVIWLMGFYCCFHSMCNLSAELLKFADRQFYRDWWNSDTIQGFWASWNIPVHRWCLRHLYKPVLHKGFTKGQAAVLVFGVSAFFHEFLVSVPLCMFRLWAFFGMLMQIPLNVITTNILGGGIVGNYIVWLSLIMGQPLAILTYLHDWYIMHWEE